MSDITPITTPAVSSTPTDINTGATLTAVPTPTPVVTPEVIPVAEVVPVVPTVEAPSVVSTEIPVATVEAPKETILGEAPKPVTPDPVVEVPKEPVATETKTEGGQSDETAPPPKFDSFTLPEGVSLDPERVSKFTELLSKVETEGKASHDFVQKFGQEAVDFHVNEVKNAVENVTKMYQTAWSKQVNDWKESFLSDPVIGGNRWETTVTAAQDFIRTHGGTETEQTELRAALESSGLGNHPAVLRTLANAGRAMSEGKPLAASRPVSAPKSKVVTLYGNNK